MAAWARAPTSSRGITHISNFCTKVERIHKRRVVTIRSHTYTHTVRSSLIHFVVVASLYFKYAAAAAPHQYVCVCMKSIKEVITKKNCKIRCVPVKLYFWVTHSRTAAKSIVVVHLWEFTQNFATNWQKMPPFLVNRILMKLVSRYILIYLRRKSSGGGGWRAAKFNWQSTRIDAKSHKNRLWAILFRVTQSCTMWFWSRYMAYRQSPKLIGTSCGRHQANAHTHTKLHN